MAKNLMIQGTMSGAGKSILTAGLLRVMKQDGYKVAPFKSQNMALNSYVTRDGKEMGRAQVLQAQAAGILPSSDMNPILLKPMGDTTSQVIINGEPIGNMKAAEYFRMKTKLIPDIKKAYDRLADSVDIVVIEGAGSPVEINLRDNDIVNMGLARMVDAPVLLAGNIDPGGVFAQLLGTIELLPPEDRARVKGLIINKFRGDKTLLEPGLDMFREYCDISFAGVVPYVKLELEEEDSVSERLSGGFGANAGEGKNGTGSGTTMVRVEVIRLPYISNYTDFLVLENTEGVDVIYATAPSQLEDADLIIIPGTKNTLQDMKWLEESGFAETIKKRNSVGTLVIGVCGGYQMLGRTITDAEGAEAGGNVKGLGLLSIDTVFSAEKTLRQVETVIDNISGMFSFLNGTKVSGYEIHMGVSHGDGGAEPSGQVNCGDGGVGPLDYGDGVLGSYIHGIFDTPDFTERILRYICDRKGLDSSGIVVRSAAETRDRELDKLAGVIRDNLDMEMIYRIIGI